jgi:hypothetical protein
MGHIEIWGNIVPNLLVLAGRAIKEVSERIPISGFKLSDRGAFGLAKKTSEALLLSDFIKFSEVKKLSEDLQSNLADSAVFGSTTLESEDLQGPLSESVTITNV